ncbi:MAG: hypothetical protein Q9222_007518 [Ikaeria aurantiellina]
MKFVTPEGHDFALRYNIDVWGILQIVFCVVYTVILCTLCWMLWQWRNHPVMRMRKIPMAICAVLVLHVYLIMVLVVYTVNGYWPCDAEFWIMSIYLPIGIGLFQVQNQQLLLISRGQRGLLKEDMYKPLPSGKTLREYYWNKFVIWCRSVKGQDNFEGFIAVGMLIQVRRSSSPLQTTKAPSIIWQAVWNYIAGPYLLYKIRMIHDIYQWRLQTTLAIVAGLPGTPLWLIAVYSDWLTGVSKYWNGAMWFAPGLIMMEMTAILMPLMQCWKIHKQAQETERALSDFDRKLQHGVSDPNASTINTSVKTRSTRGSMETMESLDKCLTEMGSTFTEFLQYCTTKSFNGENLMFLEKAIKFKADWTRMMSSTALTQDQVRLTMYRAAVHIYLTSVCEKTAPFQINIEGRYYDRLKSLFDAAATMIACRRPASHRSNSAVTPWDEPLDPMESNDQPILLRSMAKNSTTALITDLDTTTDAEDPFADITVPAAFDVTCFDQAVASVKHMLWQQPWQDFSRSKRTSTASA